MKEPDGPASDGPKPASQRVAARNAAVLDALPFGDTQDFADAARGFLGSIEDAHILGDRGRAVWTLKTFRFLDTKSAASTSPT
jgi:alkyl sulfatase BDS1-like metallo-beta-lactamase superfamily hydrolase